MTSLTQSRIIKISLYAAIILVPPTLSILLPLLFYNKLIFDFVPAWSDEIHYWMEINAFQKAGFNTGYFVSFEQPATAKFTHFGFHGPVFPMLYGVIGRVIGWKTYSGVLINLVIVPISLTFFLWRSKLTNKQLLLLLGLVTFLWPLHLWLVSNMQEALHISFAFLIAPSFNFLLSKDVGLSKLHWIFLFALLIIMFLLRPTWVVVLIPILFLSVKQKSMLYQIGALLSGMVGTLAILIIFSNISSPYYNSISLFSQILAQSKWLATITMLDWFGNNLSMLFSFLEGNPLQLMLWWQLIIVVILFLTIIGFYLRKVIIARSWELVYQPDFYEAVFHVINLAPIFLAALLVNNFGLFRGYRAFAGHLLFSILILILRKTKRPLILAFIAGNALITPVFLQEFNEMHRDQFFPQFEQEVFDAMRQVTNENIVFDPNKDPWCNTLLAEEDFSPYITVPAGIGIALKFEAADLTKENFPLKSKYIILDDHYTNGTLFKFTNVEEVAKTPFGTLYINLDSNCN